MQNKSNSLETYRELFIKGHFSPKYVKDRQEYLKKHAKNKKTVKDFCYYPDWEKIIIAGVTWSNKLNKWRASIRIKGKRIYLGSFDTETEACSAYLKAKREMK